MSNYRTNKDLYFDEAMRLYFEEGMSCPKIADLIPVTCQSIAKWVGLYKKMHSDNPVIRNVSSPRKFERAKKLYESGFTATSISRHLSAPRKTVFEWIAIFAPVDQEQDMSIKTPSPQQVPQPKDEKEKDRRIAELELALKEAQVARDRAELARDAYDELINVAEAKFGIPIRKKAGAKQ